MSREMQIYLQKNFSMYVFVTVLFIMGVIFGALLVNALSVEQKQEISSFLSSFFQLVNQGNLNGGAVSFQHVFVMNVKWIFLIWIFGLSVIGFPLILLLDFLKGVLVGFTVGYLVGQLSWHGLLFALAAIAPQNLLFIPAIIIASVSSISFSLYLIKNRFFQKIGTLYPQFVSFSLVALAMIFVMGAASILEAYLSPMMMHWITPTLTSLKGN